MRFIWSRKFFGGGSTNGINLYLHEKQKVMTGDRAGTSDLVWVPSAANYFDSNDFYSGYFLERYFKSVRSWE